MPDVIIWDPIDRLLWGMAITIFLLAAIQYLRKAREREVVNEKLLMYGFSCIFFGCAAYRIIFYLAEFLIQGTFRDYAFYGNYQNLDVSINLLFVYAMISLGTGISLFIFFFELSVKRTKFVLSIISFSILIIVIIYPLLLIEEIIRIIVLMIFVILFVIIILYLTKWSIPEFKAISSLFLFGLTLIVLGIGTSYSGIRLNIPLPSFVGPVLVMIGTIITVLPTFINPKIFSQALPFWIIIGILCISLTMIFGLISLFYGAPRHLSIAFLLFISILVFVLYKAIKMTKVQSVKADILKNTESHSKLLSIFTKPQKITEEEVSVSKEKKICLVCKGKLSRTIYICPECMAFYCKKCSTALADLENACWVCELPFDESKPIKLLKEDEVAVKKIGKPHK
ncbi:MAG: hypothetical protein ACFFAH_01460 [Promethearchaeota archaeon]